jgi:hypothetical protein
MWGAADIAGVGMGPALSRPGQRPLFNALNLRSRPIPEGRISKERTFGFAGTHPPRSQ